MGSDSDTEYTVRLSPRAEAQIRELSPMVSAVVQARLQRLAMRTRSQRQGEGRREPVQGHLIGKTFRALYEVDHEERLVTVLDVAPRS
ncbi:MAG: hypothetical protein IRZ16_14010 [Myxococcaceae bacterium]|nr:hypothetical protein [Myxococcaceae bacterium]